MKADWPEYLVHIRFELTDEQMTDTLAYIKQYPEAVEADYIAGRCGLSKIIALGERS